MLDVRPGAWAWPYLTIWWGISLCRLGFVLRVYVGRASGVGVADGKAKGCVPSHLDGGGYQYRDD